MENKSEGKMYKTFNIILTSFTLLSCLCSLAYGWGVIRTEVYNDKRRVDKIELYVVESSRNTADILIKIGILQEKIETMQRDLEKVSKNKN